MTRFHPTRLVLAFCVLLVIIVGCDSKKPTKTTDTRTPEQYFKEQQSSTMTPYGKIKTDSVKEKDGKLQYKTEDGKQWRVTYSKRADGTYEYGTPDEVK